MGRCPDPIRLILDRKRMPPVWLQTTVVRAGLARGVGGFDPRIRGIGEDEDFLFRLALRTGFCFVNKPLLVADRRPADERHSGPSALWNQAEFQLGQSQYRYEKQLRLCQGLPRAIRRSVRTDLACLHSAWANYWLGTGDASKAHEAMSASLQYRLSASLAAKRALIAASPKLALRLVALNAARKMAPRKRRGDG
jgi:hypothetical protein